MKHTDLCYFHMQLTWLDWSRSRSRSRSRTLWSRSWLDYVLVSLTSLVLPGKTRFGNGLQCVEWDVKLNSVSPDSQIMFADVYSLRSTVFAVSRSQIRQMPMKNCCYESLSGIYVRRRSLFRRNCQIEFVYLTPELPKSKSAGWGVDHRLEINTNTDDNIGKTKRTSPAAAAAAYRNLPAGGLFRLIFNLRRPTRTW